MRILFLTGEFPPLQGGVGDCTNEIARALAQRGVEVSVLTSDPSSVISNQSSVSNLQSPVSNLHIFRTIQKWNWSALAQIRKTISEIRPDIAHIQYQTGAFGMHPMINFLPRFLSPSLFRRGGRGVRSVVTFHDLLPAYLFPKAGPLRDWVTFQLARSADAVIATNEQDYQTLGALNLKLLTLIPIGSNIAPTAPPPDFSRANLRARLDVRDDETLLVYFGFLNASKGAETLIHALRDLPNAKLLFLGGQTGASDPTNVAYAEHVKEIIRDWRLENRVLWTDYLPAEQVSAHFYAADVCVLPYRDGASFRRGSFMAALAHGMPIITTNAESGTRKVESRERKAESQKWKAKSDGENGASALPMLRDGENVLLVPPDDPAAIVAAVTRLQNAPDLQHRLGANARRTARAFSWDKIADEHIALYEKMLR
jgi:glycosyltransferase involved in cell wall biosynthesis